LLSDFCNCVSQSRSRSGGSDQSIFDFNLLGEEGDDEPLFDLPESLLELDCTGMADEDNVAKDPHANMSIEEYEGLPFVKHAKDKVLARCTGGLNADNDPFLRLLEQVSNPDFQEAVKKEFAVDDLEYNAEHIDKVIATMKDANNDASDILDPAVPPTLELIQAAERTKVVASALKVAQTGAKSGGSECARAMTEAANSLLGVAREIKDKEDSKKPAAEVKRKADSDDKSIVSEVTKRTKMTNYSTTEVFMYRSEWD